MAFFKSRVKDGGKTKSRKEMPIETMHQHRCRVCPRNNDSNLINPKIEPTGASKKCRVYILGEAPGENEDKRGRQFVGKSGRLLRDNLPGRWDKHIRWNNTIRCRPPKNRDPLPQEIECCRKLQEEDIAEHKPEVIVLVGGVPTNWMFPKNKRGIGAWRGRLIPVQVAGHKCFAYPILHPSGVLRRSGGSKYKSDGQKVFERDLQQLFRALKDGLPEPVVTDPETYFDGIDTLERGDERDLQKLRKMLRRMARERVCGIDIETKNLRPYKEDSKILTCSITTRKHGTLAFPVHKTDAWRKPSLAKKAAAALDEFLRSDCRKVCHNATFEQEWFAYDYGMDVLDATRWGDTMALAYALDSRKGMLNLGILTQLHFGFNVKELSEVDTRGNLDAVPTPELLLYNGLDSKWTLELYFVLKKLCRKAKLLHVEQERVRTGISAVGAQLAGVPVHWDTVKKLDRQLQRLMRKEIRKGRKTRAWAKFAAKVGRDPNPDSHPDMVELFDKIMKVRACRTDSGGVTTNDAVLSKLPEKRYPVAPIILEMRSIGTVKGTFIDPLPELVYPDGRLHTNYNTMFTTSSRFSSEDPNLQNWPKHKWKIIRQIIQDADGNIWVISFDYGQIEARVIAMASKDDVFVQMLWDEYDVHMEWAQRIHDEWKGCLKAMHIDGKWSDDGVPKLYRQEVKNKWVFPLFFGSNERSVAENLNMPGEVAKHLYREFWSVFEGIKEWQEELLSFYDKNGYVETLTGKRRNAPCSYNEIINHPIQGTASDIVVDAGNRLRKKGFQYNLNVHDDLTFLMRNDPKQIKAIAKEMCRPSFDFINVPLLIEIEAGKNWAEQKPIGEYSSDKDFKFH